MRIAIPFCRAFRGAKQTTLGKALTISVAAVLLAAGPALANILAGGGNLIRRF